MSENNTQQAAVEENQVAFTVTGNKGTAIPIIIHKVQKGLSVGREYYAPDLEKIETLEQLTEIFPLDKLLENLIRPALNRFCLAISKEAEASAKDDKGVLQDEYTKMFLQVSARGESIKALNERKNDLLCQLAKIDPSTNLDEFLAVAKKIKNIEQTIQEKKSKDDDEDDKTEATPAAPAKAA